MHKFGYSNNLINRFKQHEYDFGEISIEFVMEAPEVQEIEKRLKNDIRSHGINTVFEIDGRKLKELFEPQYFQRVCEIINDIINNYKKDSFTSAENHDYRMIAEKIKLEEEKTKQEQEKTRQMQCEIELLKLRIQLEELSRKRKVEEMN
jgi:transposase-like protein